MPNFMVYVIAVCLYIIAMVALVGNGMLIIAICTRDFDFVFTGGESIVTAITLLTDFIVICLVIYKYRNSIFSSLATARLGIKKRVKIKKDSRILKSKLEKEQYYVMQLNELRNQNIDSKSTALCMHFCQLFRKLGYTDQIIDCIRAVNQKNNYLIEISNIEKKLLEIANIYKEMGNVDKCKYCLTIIKNNNTPADIEVLEAECEDLILLREKERREITRWCIIFSVVIFFLVVIFVYAYR